MSFAKHRLTPIFSSRHALATVAAASLLALAACSESDEPEATAEAVTPAATAEPAPAPAPAPAPVPEAAAEPETEAVVPPAPAPAEEEAAAPPIEVDCTDYDFAGQFFEAYNSLTPLVDTAEAAEKIQSVAYAECQQDRLIAKMAAAGASPIGLKVGLVTKAAQEQFGVSAPLIGVIFDGMMRDDGATIAVNSGALLGYEADMLARVSSGGINDVQDPAEILGHIDVIYPFIEVPDLMIGQGAKLTGGLIIAMNVAPRFGVMGAPIDVVNTVAWANQLGAVEIVLTSGDGEELVRAVGTDLLGHPLASAFFLVNQAKRRGWRLEPGDLISLGSFGPLQFAQPGGAATLTYEGLTSEPATVSVNFE